MEDVIRVPIVFRRFEKIINSYPEVSIVSIVKVVG